MMGSRPVATYLIEFYEDEHGDEPARRWLRDELSPRKRRALGRVFWSTPAGSRRVEACTGVKPPATHNLQQAEPAPRHARWAQAGCGCTTPVSQCPPGRAGRSTPVVNGLLFVLQAHGRSLVERRVLLDAYEGALRGAQGI